MKEDLKKKIDEIEDCISNIGWDLEDVQKELDNINNLIEQSEKGSIKNIDNFKRELKREGLHSEKLDDFIEQYMIYYNN